MARGTHACSHRVQQQPARVCVSGPARPRPQGTGYNIPAGGSRDIRGAGLKSAIVLQRIGCLPRRGLPKMHPAQGHPVISGGFLPSQICRVPTGSRRWNAVLRPSAGIRPAPWIRISGPKPRFRPAQSDDAGLWHNPDKGKRPAGPAQDRGGKQETQTPNALGSDDMDQTPSRKMGGMHAD